MHKPTSFTVANPRKKTNSINGCSSYHIKTNQQWWDDNLTAKSIKIYELDKPRECSPCQIRRSMVRRRRRLLGFRGGNVGEKGLGFWSIGFCPGQHYLMSEPNQTKPLIINQMLLKKTFWEQTWFSVFLSHVFIRALNDLSLLFYFEQFNKSRYWKIT